MTAPTASSERRGVSTGRRLRLTKRLRRAGGIALFLGLGACGYFTEPVYQPPCPRAAVLADAQEVTSFRPGPGRDLTDILYEGFITSVGGNCDYNEDGYVEVQMDIGFELAIGPALEDGIGHWRYFVIVVDPDGQRIAKQIFTIDLAFEPATFQTRLIEQTTQRIVYSPWADATGYRIFVGFQLSREELDYMRSRQR